MQRIRRVMFALFVLAYLILCPLTIAYALGYLVTPWAEQGMVKTGLISLETIPPGASVYVEKRRYTKQTPTTLRNLLPGRYTVTLTLNGYQPWTAVMPVEPGRATALEKIALLPWEWKPRILLRESFDNLLPTPERSLFLLTRGRAIKDAVLYDAQRARSYPLVSDPAWRDARLLSCLGVAGSRALLLRVRAHAEDAFLWLELKRKGPRLEDVTSLFPEKPQRVLWSSPDPRYVFALQHDDVNRVDIAARAVYPKWLEHVRGLGVSGHHLDLLLQDGLLQRTDLEGRNPTPLLEDPRLGRTLVHEKGWWQMTPLDEETVLLWGEAGELVSNRSPYALADHGVMGVEVSPRQGRALVWQHDRVGIVELALSASDDQAEERTAAQLRWVWLNGERIEQAFWAYDESHVVLRDREHVWLFDLQPSGVSEPQRLLDVKKNTSVVYREASGQLYYLDPATGLFSMIELMPRHPLIALPFTEERDGVTSPGTGS